MRALWLNETKIPSKNGNYLGLEVTMNKVTTKKLCLGYVYRFVTIALILRPGNT